MHEPWISAVGSISRRMRCQKYETGWHWRVRIKKKIIPTTAVTPMTVYRMTLWVRRTVKRSRATAIELFAMAQTQT
jgi:hypothetical protein